MHIIECHFEFSGFDDRLVKAGTSVYLWNLVRQFRDAGHRVTAVTPAHGLLEQLRQDHPVAELDWTLSETVPVRLDPAVWTELGPEVALPVTARAHRVEIEGIEIVLLAGGVLDHFTDSFYPPRDREGRDPAFLKPLAFQVAAARYLAQHVRPGDVVHLHEPIYHYLLPAALAGHGVPVVSTVQTNLPVNTKVYGPEVRSVLTHLGADPAVADGLADPPLDSGPHRAMRAFLPRTGLYADSLDRPDHDYLSMLALVARSATAMDFLSEGQLDHALTQAETPFEQLFGELAVGRELRRHADRMVVAGCAIGDEWHDVPRSDEQRARTLGALDLDPSRPTIYHNSRYSVQHKGQKEMFRALQRLLDDGVRCNVLLHCIASPPPHDDELDRLAKTHPDLVRVGTTPIALGELIARAAASDISVFPSKFEMDTFLMAMGEAMAAGAVPVATAQRGMRHFGHRADLSDPDATGLAVPRSFRVDDTLLTDAVHTGLRQLIDLLHTDPDRFERLRRRAIEVARRFTWAQVARRFLAVFEACQQGRSPAETEAGAAHLLQRPARPVADAGHGRAEPAAGEVALQWSAPQAARIELITAGDPVVVQELQRTTDGIFRADLPSYAAADSAVLVTTTDGRSAWAAAPPADRSTVDTAASAPSPSPARRK